MAASRLSQLQQDLIQEFFNRHQGFFLTGGAALAGFHLCHRTTEDLDLFVTSDLLDEGERTLSEAALALGASVENIQTSPTFRRRLVRRGVEGVVVDLVFDQIPQLCEDKPNYGKVRVDPPEEILANKLCALLSRAEIRDLVDALTLDRAGFPIEVAISGAVQKDGGFTPAQLAWVLSEIELGDDAVIPGDWDVARLREAMTQLRARLTRIAFPESSDDS